MGLGNFILNAAVIASESLKSPLKSSLIDLDDAKVVEEVPDESDAEQRSRVGTLSDEEDVPTGRPESIPAGSPDDDKIDERKNRDFGASAPSKATKPPSPSRRASPALKKTAELQSNFKLVFLSVLGLTVAAVLFAISIAYAWPTPTANQQAVFEGVSFTWKAGIGAIFGLLGGKVA